MYNKPTYSTVFKWHRKVRLFSIKENAETEVQHFIAFFQIFYTVVAAKFS